MLRMSGALPRIMCGVRGNGFVLFSEYFHGMFDDWNTAVLCPDGQNFFPADSFGQYHMEVWYIVAVFV